MLFSQLSPSFLRMSQLAHADSCLREACRLALRDAGRVIRPGTIEAAPAKALDEALGDTLIGLWKSSDELCAACDAYMAAAPAPPPACTVDTLPPAAASVPGVADLHIWRGDITRLEVGAIVNAANTQGLGCFQPSHRCVDNVIHRAAGPRLREACREALVAHPERTLYTGTAMVTPAYGRLPCAHVVHTVGPQLARGQQRPTEEDCAQLAACYESCLDAVFGAAQRPAANRVDAAGSAASRAATATATAPSPEDGTGDEEDQDRRHGDGDLVDSIAFCAISTGLFGFPKEEAAKIAVATTLAWAKRRQAASVRPDDEAGGKGIVQGSARRGGAAAAKTVVFCVFGDEDEAAYSTALSTVAGDCCVGEMSGSGEQKEE